jgi:hypothetical protein
MDTSLYININKDRVWSSVYVPTKDVVKSYGLETKDVFEFESELEETIKLSFFSGARLLTCIGYFDPHHLSMELSTFKETDGSYYADKVILRDQKLKIEIHCQDISLGFTSMTDDQVGRAFDKSTSLLNFTLSREDLSKVSQLLSLDKSELFEIYCNSEGVHIKTDAFDIVVDDSKTKDSPISKSTFKSFLEKVDKETYEISLCENKLLLESQESATKIALNLAITE